MKELKEKVKRCNEISNKADNYLKSKSISSVLDENNRCKPIFVNNMPKISEMKEGVEYIEKGTGSTVKIPKLKEDKDGAAKEKDNKENI